MLRETTRRTRERERKREFGGVEVGGAEEWERGVSRRAGGLEEG